MVAVSVFQKSAYKMLQQVPSGTTVTYGQLAQQAGHPNRVVRYSSLYLILVSSQPLPLASLSLMCSGIGQAMARNPLPLLIPCHRVVPASRASGSECFGNYSRGRLNRVKPFLIALERLRLK